MYIYTYIVYIYIYIYDYRSCHRLARWTRSPPTPQIRATPVPAGALAAGLLTRDRSSHLRSCRLPTHEVS